MAADAEPVGRLLRRLRWTVLRPLALRPSGDERSLLHGPGVEFAAVREYVPGDDVRRIDWALTARSDRPFVRESHTERALDAWLVVDVSASVDWGTAAALKRTRAVELAAVVAQLIAQHGNRIGALLFAERPLAFVPPGRGRLHLERVIASLRDEPSRRGHGPTDLAAALRQVGLLVRRPALLVLITDFLTPQDWVEPLRALAGRHEVVAVRVRDPREADLPDVGLVTLEDPETGVQRLVNTADRALRARFRAAALAQDAEIRRVLGACGVDLGEIGTDAPLLPALVRLLEARRQRRLAPPRPALLA